MVSCPFALAAFCAVALSLPLPSPAAQDTENELETYFDAVVRHEPGTFAPAQDDVQKLTERETLTVGRALKELAEAFEGRRWQGLGPPTNFDRIVLARRSYSLRDLAVRLGLHPERPNDVRPFLRRAALFHLDAMVSHAREGASTWVLRHEDLGNTVAGLLVTVCHESAFAADWWFAVVGSLTMPMPHAARLAAEHALKSLTGVARLELAAGSVYEALASPRMQEAVAVFDEGRKAAEHLDAALRSPATNLRRATELFRRAVEPDAHTAESHLRLGRVLCLSSDAVGAREQLELAREEAAGDVFVAYHAAMFLGDLEERAGRPQAAEPEYRKALALVPQAQAPRLALSHLRHASGQPREALDQIATFLAASRPLGDREEPWLSYGLGAGRETDAVFRRLLEECER